MATFKPVKEVDDQMATSHETFTPVKEYAPGPTSALTGEPIPTEDERAQLHEAALSKYKQGIATGVRYGGPVAGGMLLGGAPMAAEVLGGGLITAGSEITARQIERAGTDPEMNSLWADIKAGGIAGAIDAGVSTLMHGVGRGVLNLARRFVLPRNIPREVELAQAVLATPSKNQAAKQWYRWKGNDPFSLSAYQLNPDEQGLVYHLESVARSGFGAGRFKKFDERNTSHAQAAILDYVQQRAQQATGPEFGAFVNRILGETNKPGELFKPVEAYRSWLYDRYKKAMATIPDAAATKIDGSGLRKIFLDTKDSRLLEGYSDLIDSGVLPPLKDEEAWQSLDVMDVDEAIHQMNGWWEKGKQNEKWNNKVKFVQRQLREPYDNFINKHPQLRSYREAANKFYGSEQDTLHREIIKTIRANMIDNPSTVLDMINPTSGKPGKSYDTLMHLKRSIFFSGATPETPGKGIAGMGTGAAKEMYEKSILRPLRFEFLAGSTDAQTGIMDANKVLSRIKRIEDKGVPELLDEIWGNREQVKRIKDLFTAMAYQQGKAPGKSVWIQLKTMAAVTAGGGGIWAFASGDNPTRAATGIGGAAIILMSPAILAKAMTNPRLTRALYDGFSDQRIFTGVPAKLSLALRKCAQTKAATEINEDVKKPDGNMWYRFRPVEEQPSDGTDNM
jgi:hypothetical protein